MKGYCKWLLFCLSLPIYFAQVKSQRSGGSTCSEHKVPCDNYFQCVPRNYWCDGDEHCLDRSDEQYCVTKAWYQRFTSVNDCTEKHFECGDGPCVPIATKCDGFHDCKDGSDEDYCDKTEEDHSDFEETTTEPHINTIIDVKTTAGDVSFSEIKTDDIFDSNSQHNNFPDPDSIITTSETVEEASSPNYVASAIPVPYSPAEDYYAKRSTESTNDYSNLDYNKARNVNPRYSYDQQGSYSVTYSSSRREQTDTPHTRTQYNSGGNNIYPDETIVKLPKRAFPGIVPQSMAGTGDTNSQHGSEGNIRSENYDETLRPLRLVYPRSTESSILHSSTGYYGPEDNVRSGHSDDIIVKLPPRVFPGTYQSSIPDTHYPNSQHINENDVRLGHSSAASVTSSSYTFPPAVQRPISAPRGNVRSSQSGETIIKLPPRVFFTNIQPSNTHYDNSQHINEKDVRSGYSSRAPVTSHTFPPTIHGNPPSIPITHRNEANVRSGPSGDTIVRLPPRIFPHTTQPFTSDTNYANSQHGNTENAKSWEQRRPLSSSADYPAAHLNPLQLADDDNSAYGLQSDAYNQPENHLQRNRRDAPFNFKYNYTEKLGYHYKNNVQKAKDWILSQRNVSFGWGKDTPRALIALSLMTNTFSFKFTENELMKKSLATGFGIRMHLMREKDNSNNNTNILTNSTLASYINALLATCQDPKYFFSNDLTQELLHKTTFSDTDVNPFVYLTLCLTNTPINDSSALHKLQRLLTMEHQDERSSDMQILATTALACFQRQNQQLQRQLEPIVKAAFNKLKERRLSDYSFGSKYSTALAAQALMSIDTDEWYDARKTLDFLAKTQERDGSFGDMLATYLIVPALSGRSLLHLRNTECDPVIPQPDTTEPSTEFVEGPGPIKNIYYTIKVGYPETRTITTSCLEIGDKKSFLYAMRKAQHYNSQFRFLYKVLDNYKTDVHTIIDIPNDTERGFRWRLFRGDARRGVEVNFQQPIEEDVAELFPENYEEFVYWYLPMML